MLGMRKMWPSILLSIHSDGCHTYSGDEKKICAIVGNWNLNKGRNIYKDGNPTSALLWHVLNTISNYQFVTEDGIIQFLYSSMISPLSMKFYFIPLFFYVSWIYVECLTHISAVVTQLKLKKINSKLPAKALSHEKNVKKYSLMWMCISITQSKKKQFSNFTHNVFKNGKCYKSKLK